MATRITPRTITLTLPTRRTWRAVLVVVFLLVWPLIGNPLSLLGDAIQACIILVVTVSLVLLTGWVGQISLAQATFVGIGAFSTGILSRNFGVPFPLNLLGAGLVAGGGAALLGVVALRVRGLYLAVATLIFAWMADEYLFNASWLVGVGGSSSVKGTVIGRTDAIPRFDLSDRRALYYVVLAAAAAALYIAANLRDSKTGRALFAVRGSEMAAASLGIDVTRYKLLAFAISGFFAGVAGNLIMTGQRSAVPAQFTFTFSLFYLAVAVVGGLSSLGGAVASSIMFAGLAELFFRVRALGGWLEIVSAGLLALVLLVYPGGLAAVPQSFARPWRVLRQKLEPVLQPVRARLRLDRRAEDVGQTDVLSMPEVSDETSPVLRPGARLQKHALPANRDDRAVVLEADGIIVQFGGLRAVDDVSLTVRQGEIVGLIGPNGAGKTTTFNAIAGLNVPTAGTVRIFGTDVTDLPVHERAKLGVARTFQVIQLFPQLTVFENLLVATHLQNDSSVADHIIVTRGALQGEELARRRVRRVIKLLNLEEVADRRIAGLPFGVLRMVEVARAVVTGAPFIMLDEPASGLDNTETDRLADLLFFLRGELGVSILLIEHDVRMVTAVSDYLYVINRGRPLANGFPADVVRDQGVIAAYLGEAPAGAEVG
jgi:ABC-type branched-subunit amino acid transport system ATPase component/ABC-type branched-subunit amino acid transport system permease subunit